MSNKKICVFASLPEAMDISLRLYDLKHLKVHASRTMDTSPWLRGFAANYHLDSWKLYEL